MNKIYRKYAYPVALFLAVAAGTASAQSQSVAGPQGLVSQTETEDLVFMREEEKMARDSYLLLAEQWGLAVFSNIAKSEQKHMDAIEVLINGFGIADPVVDESDVGTFANLDLQDLFDELMDAGSQSAMDGLKVGGIIEETDILDIEEAIERSENEDIIATYENLLCGSRNHLRAFVGQIELLGEIYTPILLSEDELNAIVDFPMERGCGNGQQSRGKPGKGKNGAPGNGKKGK